MDIKKLLEKAISYKASDLHIAPNSPALYRINGDLRALDSGHIFGAGEITEMLAELKKSALNSVADQRYEFDFAYDCPDLGRFRVNLFQQLQGFAATFRVIGHTPHDLNQLGLPSALLNTFNANDGLILVTGKAGMGKSTTLAAIIEYINVRHHKHIITLEDPIEFIHTSKQCLITQREIFSHSDSFNSALRAALREDPDVIIVGEIRDAETMQLVLRAAETGHLVIATLHTHSATHSINRIIDFFPSAERIIIQQQLADILLAVLCQKLIKRINHTRKPLFECLISNAAIKHLIRENKIAQIRNILQTGEQSGMFTFEQFAAYHDVATT